MSGYIPDPKRRYRQANLIGCGAGCLVFVCLYPVIFGVLWAGAHSDPENPQSWATFTWIGVFAATLIAFVAARAIVLRLNRTDRDADQ